MKITEACGFGTESIIAFGDDFTELWDGVLYKALSDYPNVSDNEIKDIIDFAAYEKANRRVDFFHYVMFS